MKEWDKSLHKLNLAVKYTDYEAASRCFDRLNDCIKNQTAVPHELLSEFFSYLVDGEGSKAIKLAHVQEAGKPYIQQVKNHFSARKGYSFSGSKKVYEPAFQIPHKVGDPVPPIPKGTTYIRTFSFDTMIERAVTDFLSKDKPVTKEQAIELLYLNLTAYHTRYLNKAKQDQMTFYRRSVLAAYLAHVFGYKLSESDLMTPPALFQYSRHSLAKYDPKKKKKSSKKKKSRR